MATLQALRRPGLRVVALAAALEKCSDGDSIRFFFVCVASNCSAAPSNAKAPRHYRVEVPGWSVDYTIPTQLVPGYGGQRSAIDFKSAKDANAVAAFGRHAQQRGIAVFYHGVVGDFRDWDMTIELFVVQFSKGTSPIRTTEELLHYLQAEVSRKLLLKGGEELSTAGTIRIERIHGREIAVVTAADLYHSRKIVLANGSLSTVNPYQTCYLRLDDRIVLGVRRVHVNEKRLNPKWHERARSMVDSIIKELKWAPMPVPTNGAASG